MRHTDDTWPAATCKQEAPEGILAANVGLSSTHEGTVESSR